MSTKEVFRPALFRRAETASAPCQPRPEARAAAAARGCLGESRMVGVVGGGAGRSRTHGCPVTSRDAANFRGLVLGCIEAKFCK